MTFSQALSFFLILNTWTFCYCQLRPLKVGLLFVENVTSLEVAIGYRTSASAVLVARDRIRAEHLLDGFDLQFIHEFDECNEVLAAGKTSKLLMTDQVDVILGPTCNQPAIVSSALASYYNVPILEWGLTTAKELSDRSRFATTVGFSINSYSLALAIRATMLQFGWDQYVFLYSNDGDSEKCNSLKNDIQTVASLHDDIVLAYIFQIVSKDLEDMRAGIRAVKERGRIIVACVPSGNGSKKSLMQAAMLEDANTSEFVYIMAETNSRGFIVDETGGKYHYLWEGSAQNYEGLSNEESQISMRNLLFLVDNMGMAGEITPQFLNFSQRVIDMMKEAPFYCTTDCQAPEYSSVAKYAGQLADAFYAYAVALNRTLVADPNANIRNGTAILNNMGLTFEGVGGRDVTVDPNGSRRNLIYLIGLNYSLLPEVYAQLSINNQSMEFVPLYKQESDVWNGRPRPKTVPECGFKEDSCPPNFIRDYLIYTIIIAIVIIFAITSAIGGILYASKMKQLEMERQDMMWHVAYSELQMIIKKGKADASLRSFASGPSSTSTKLTWENRTETTRFIFYQYNGDLVAANKHVMRMTLTVEDKLFLREMRTLDHDNLNKFVGLCENGPQPMSVWKFCSRGSLSDVIGKSSMQMDGFFIFSLIRDIANGVAYIHNSFLGVHGYLTSKSCLIDDRWQIKISDYGLPFIRQFDKLDKMDMLWSAPEILRNEMAVRTKEADVYSFGIICSEVVTRHSAFDFENRKEKVEELIYQIKKGGFNPTRPSLEVDESLEVNPALLHLIRDCWTEKPSERPGIDQVKSQLRSMSDGRKGNLMDHVFNVLETYASNLEEEVSERMKELVEEKKKSDVLLYRMLPKTVAEKLKSGVAIEPETFQMVTIFFSDVVQFTTLASKCTPLQVVTLLNDLYTIFDEIIEQHDVYKVETIGDGYLCVSGLPHRNGNEHIRHIARMALGFLSSLGSFRVPHLPNERINLRIGINCGIVVAGVVGLTMPRYCLFGDAVNTASRMESNGKPGRIHASSDANNLLLQVGGFQTESRGEVIIKGKGVMETYWLLGEDTKTPQSSSDVRLSSASIKSLGSSKLTPRSVTPSGLYSEYKKSTVS